MFSEKNCKSLHGEKINVGEGEDLEMKFVNAFDGTTAITSLNEIS